MRLYFGVRKWGTSAENRLLIISVLNSENEIFGGQGKTGSGKMLQNAVKTGDAIDRICRN